jgi:hypothetical protein
LGLMPVPASDLLTRGGDFEGRVVWTEEADADHGEDEFRHELTVVSWRNVALAGWGHGIASCRFQDIMGFCLRTTGGDRDRITVPWSRQSPETSQCVPTSQRSPGPRLRLRGRRRHFLFGFGCGNIHEQARKFVFGTPESVRVRSPRCRGRPVQPPEYSRPTRR